MSDDWGDNAAMLELSQAQDRIAELESKLQDAQNHARLMEASDLAKHQRQKELEDRLDHSEKERAALLKDNDYRGDHIDKLIVERNAALDRLGRAEKLLSDTRNDLRQQWAFPFNVAQIEAYFADLAPVVENQLTVAVTDDELAELNRNAAERGEPPLKVVERHSPNSNDGHDWAVNEPGTLYVCSGCGQTRPRV